MRSHLVSGLLFTCFAALGAFGGCVVDVDPQQTGDELGIAPSEAITPANDGAFYALYLCRAPYCDGYFVKEVNQHQAQSIVTQISFAGLDAETIGDIAGAPHGDVLIRGRFVTPRLVGSESRFVITEAYRALPGIAPVASDTLWSTPERRPPIVCFAAPCNNILATPLNSEQTRPFTRLSLQHALPPMVDAAWIEHLILRNEALVSGQFREEDRELVMEVSEVYLKLPVERPLCEVLPHRVCPSPLRATFTRDANRCLAFDTCADDSQVVPGYPPKCEEAYVRRSWQIADSPGTEYVCDPAFAR